MLDRILNITPQDKYKSGTKITASQLYSVNRHPHERQHAKDSALFSPLAKLLSQLNWRIINLQYSGEDEMLFHVLVNDIEIITVLDFRKLYSEPYHQFTLMKTINEYGKEIKSKININSLKENLGVLEKPNHLNTIYLDEMFSSISEFRNVNQAKISDQYTLNQIIEGKRAEISEELNLILKAICTFISTRHVGKIKNNFLLNTSGNNPIILKEISFMNTV